MTTDNTRSSATSSSSRSSSPRPDLSASSAPPSPSVEFPPSSAHPNPFVESPIPGTTRYSPHAVGLGIISPQPVAGPLSSASRGSLPSSQHSSSPTLRRSSSAGPPSPYRPQSSFDPSVRSTPLSEDLQPPRLSSSPFYISSPRSDDNTASISDMPPTPGASSAAAGLHIDIPPPNATASTSTPSPPLLQSAANLLSSPASMTNASGASQIAQAISGGAFFNPDDSAFPLGPDLSISGPDINLDFTEFDADGLSALEKIYLFSRSRAGFHRVFIVHALPRYLGADDADGRRYASSEEMECISPAEAVDYVLPLLNGLALDEDEAVKEALAAELLPIIWWFITHCRLVEEDLTTAAAQDPAFPQPHGENEHSTEGTDITSISVQAFTPILGTLLLSQNTLVGGPARHAVVQLLKRIRRADDRDEGRPTVLAGDDENANEGYEVGLLGSPQRRLLEHEIVHQVVIGMGRLDLPETDDGPLSTISTPRSGGGHHEPHFELHRSSSLDHPVTPPVPADAPDSSTAGSTPLAPPPSSAPDSYFPVMPVPYGTPSTSPATSPMITTTDDFSSTESRHSPRDIVPPPAFTLGQPPASPSPRTQAAPNMSMPSPASLPAAAPLSAHMVSSPAQLESPSSPFISTTTPATTATAARVVPPAEIVSESPKAPAPTPSSSTGSISSTPPLTSSSSSSTSSGSPALPATMTPMGPSYASVVTTTPYQERESDVNMEIEMESETSLDVIMTDEDWAPQSPKGQASESRHELSEADSPVETNLSGLGTGVSEVRGSQSSPVSTWLSAGLPAGDVSMQEVAGMGHEGAIEEEEEGDLSEEAAVGRLSSMSLMAAVTASGTLKDETKTVFVTEVERVGRDPVYWVRREAAFAVGALAKVVPDELVISSLLPLFEALYQDPTWHVRHSVLFALPAILSRLTPKRRRSLALDVLLPLSADESPTVRSAVLEALGEVIYTFAEDEDGPPQELLNMFLGTRDSGASRASSPQVRSRGFSLGGLESSPIDLLRDESGTNADIYDDPARPLVCAFNFPAVALTLGRARWPELRELYRSLAESPSFKVRRTLAASLGEMAKIIGPDHAREDLIDVWRASITAEETEVRLKAVECAALFVRALNVSERAIVIRGLCEEFAAGRLKGWREREEVVKGLGSFLDIKGIEEDVLRRMLMQGLADRVSAIREAAVAVSPAFVRAWRSTPHLITALRKGIRELAQSESYRERTTFVTCEQAVLLSVDRDFVLFDEGFWEILSSLTRDPIVDVRIRAARLLGIISDDHKDDGSIMARVLALAERLEHDSSQDVRAFGLSIRSHRVRHPTTAPPDMTRSASTFSRPPPPTPS